MAYRAIVLKPDAGNVYMLLWVDKHDDAYAWAKKRICTIHPETGGVQIVDSSTIEPPPAMAPQAVPNAALFARFRDRELMSIGVPEAQLALVRLIKTEDDLDAATARLPGEAFDALVLLAAGYSLDEAHRELDRPSERPQFVDIEDFSSALDNADSQRRFFVVDNEKELKSILAAPLEKWRVFLHPSQRKLIERDWSGPVRILGGAGTGKTVVAMHRAKWLAENRCPNAGERVLFTTFTRNLAADIQANLQKICNDAQMARIEVVNLDRWVVDFLRNQGYRFQIDYGQYSGALWEQALLQRPLELSLSPAFYREEWEQVVQSQGIDSFADYVRTSRIGRGVRLNSQERKLIWPVFEAYRVLLEQHDLREPDDAMRDASLLLAQQRTPFTYPSIIVDEAQDMSNQAFRLLRALVAEGDRGNDLFIVGDAHQRIYRHKVVLGQCSINIRGRSRKLRVNYRTTEENRRWAVGILEGVVFDDLDDGQDNQEGYRSLLHGTLPDVQHFPNPGAEQAFIVEYLQGLHASEFEMSGVCVVARTHKRLEELERVLIAAGIETHLIRGNEAEDSRISGVRLATMHRVKGLEFDRVIIAGVNRGVVPLEVALSQSGDPVLRRESEARERALLYVSATRARSALMVTSSGSPSPFLPNAMQ